jgi:DNA-binding response OmpR family regulator
MDNYTVAMLEKVSVLSIRIKNILEGSKICVIDNDNETKLFNTLSSGQNVSLVLLDIDLNDDNAMNLLIETRKRANNAPIIVLTTGGIAKHLYVEAMLQGATDFIMKPFENKLLTSKIFQYLVNENPEKTEIVMLDLNQYLKGELRKAEKGHFPVSILFLNFESNVMEDRIRDYETINYIFENTRDLFWDTDIFIRFLSKYYFGVFPFCDEKNKEVIDNKLIQRFNDLKNADKVLKNYTMVSVYVTYPYDTSDTSKIYDILKSRIREAISSIKI